MSPFQATRPADAGSTTAGGTRFCNCDLAWENSVSTRNDCETNAEFNCQRDYARYTPGSTNPWREMTVLSDGNPWPPSGMVLRFTPADKARCTLDGMSVRRAAH